MQADIIKLEDSKYAFQGDLSFNTVATITKKASKLLAFAKEVTLDFEKLKHCDSAGIALIVQWKKLANYNGSQLKFVNVTPQMQNLIDLMGLSKAL